MPDDLEGHLPAGLRQPRALVGHVSDESEGVEPLEHVRGRGRRHPHALGQGRGGDLGSLEAPVELVFEQAEPLQIVLDGTTRIDGHELQFSLN